MFVLAIRFDDLAAAKEAALGVKCVLGIWDHAGERLWAPDGAEPWEPLGVPALPADERPVWNVGLNETAVAKDNLGDEK